MPTVFTQKPDTGTISFVFDNIWTPEGMLRVTFWRDIDKNTDKHLIGGQSFKVFNDSYGVRVKGHIVVTLNDRMLLRKPRYKRRREKYFGQMVIDGFDLELYDSPVNADITSISHTINTGITITLGDTPYSRLFTKYIKPYPETEVYCIVEFKEDRAADYEYLVAGQLQNAIKGTDHRWTHKDYENPYWTFNNNQPLDRDTIWSLRFTHVAMAGLGKVPPRPTQNPSDKSSYYMPFFNEAMNSASTERGDISELPFFTRAGTPFVVVQGVHRVKYYRSDTMEESYALWRRHIPVQYWLKLICDYAFGAGNWDYTCEESPFAFYGAKLGTWDNSDRYFLNDQGQQISVEKTIERRVSFDRRAEVQNWVLLPQTLWGLYDQIDHSHPAGFSISTPVPQKHWANAHESAFDQLIELLLCFGYEMEFTNASTFAIYQRGSAKKKKFSFIYPTSATPEIFPEFESGIQVTRRETFKNAVEADGDYDDWFSTIGSTGKSWMGQWFFLEEGQRTPNPITAPMQAKDPAKFDISLVFGDMSGMHERANVQPPERIGWYSTGYPNHNNIGLWLSLPVERFPNFTPLIASNEIYVDKNTMDYTTATGKNAVGQTFMPIMLGVYNGGAYTGNTHEHATLGWKHEDSWTTLETNGYIALSFRELLTVFYNQHFVRSDEKYTITVPTITEFTDQTTGAKTKGSKSWKNIGLLYTTELFGYEWYVHAVDMDFETMQTTFELYRTNRAYKAIPLIGLEPKDGTPRYQSMTPNIRAVIGVKPSETIKGTVSIEAVVAPDAPVIKVTSKIMPVGTEYEAENVGGRWILSHDTTSSINGTYTLRIRATSADDSFADKTLTVTIAN